jgi:multicomponent K+:H+ antiporter subunit E
MVPDKQSQNFRQRWLPHPLLTLTLVVVWMLLLNSFTLGGFLLGTVLGVLIPIATSHFWPGRPLLRAYGKMMAFLGIALWDVLVANVMVARLILFRRPESLATRWVAMPLELRSPEAITLLAGTISLTPGTVSSDLSADGRTLLVHCLDAPDAEVAVRDMKSRYEARLMEIFP